MLQIIAVNKKHQSSVNKAIKLLTKYNELNDKRNLADDTDDQKLYRSLNKQCETMFDRYLDVRNELPKREIAQIEKSELY